MHYLWLGMRRLVGLHWTVFGLPDGVKLHENLLKVGVASIESVSFPPRSSPGRSETSSVTWGGSVQRSPALAGTATAS